MNLYKDSKGNVFAYEADGSQDEFILPGLTPITLAEADALRNKPPDPSTVLKPPGTSDADYAAVGDGVTDDTAALTRFFEAAIARPGVPHTLRALTYSIKSELPTINVGNVIVRGAGASIHDVGALMTGTVFVWNGPAGGVMQMVSSRSGAGNAKIKNIELTGIGYNANGTAAYGLKVLSINDSQIDVAIANATSAGLSMSVVASLGEARDSQRNRICLIARQVEAAGGFALTLGGDSGANISMNEFWCDIQHKNIQAIYEINADNNDWVFVRTYKVAGGAATEAISCLGGATALDAVRAERFRFLTSNLPMHVYGRPAYAAPANNIRIDCLDTENGTPRPLLQSGASAFMPQLNPV